MMHSRAAVFLDRDGVINEEVNYLSRPDQLVLLEGAAAAIAQLNRAAVPVVVITNQSGIARGFFSEFMVQEIHAHLDTMLAPYGAHIDGYYYCPHHPTEGLEAYRVDCACRKPQPGLLLKAAEDLHLDLASSYMIGDKASDLDAGLNAGCKPILVLTGYGQHTAIELEAAHREGYYVAPDLALAATYCLAQLVRM